MVNQAVRDAINEQFSGEELQPAAAMLLRWLDDLSEGRAETDKDGIASRAELIYDSLK